MAHMKHLATFEPINVIDLADMTQTAVRARLITRRQWAELFQLLHPHLPVSFTLSQRTPKGMLYVHIQSGAKYTINCRAKLQRIA